MKPPPLIINAAINGLIPTREMTPHVPISPTEIASEACRAGELGASIVHVHARHPDGSPSSDQEIYQEIIRLIRERFQRPAHPHPGHRDHLVVLGCPDLTRPSLAST